MIVLTAIAIALLAVVLVGQFRMQKQIDRMEVQLQWNRQEAGKEYGNLVDCVTDVRDRVLDRLEKEAVH